MDSATGQTLRDVETVIGIIRRRSWIVVLCAILAGAAAFGIAKHQHKQYTSTAAIVFTDNTVAEQASGATPTASTNPQAQIFTNLQLLESSAAVFRRTAAALHNRLSAQEIRGAVVAAEQGQPGSQVISVTVTWPDPVLAARIANSFTGAFIQQQREDNQATISQAIALVQRQYLGLTKPERLTPQGQSLLDHIESLKILKSLQNTTQLVHAAAIPTAPSSPKVLRSTVVGVVLGLIVGLGILFLLERLDRRLRDPVEVEESFGLPMLGVIPHAPLGAGPNKKSASVDPEPFRMLRANLRYFNVDRQLQTLLVTSSRPSEGKTTVARRLAEAAASMGTRTLLVEADLRRPSFSREFELEANLGLAGALVNTQTFAESVQQVDSEGRSNGRSAGGRRLDVLPAGASPPNPAELLESHAMEHLLEWAKENYEFVVIDTPPLSVVADAIPLMTRVDGVVVVSRLGLSTRDASEHLRDRLAALAAPILGVIVNDMRPRVGKYYGYSYSNSEYGNGRDQHLALPSPPPTSGEQAQPVAAAAPPRSTSAADNSTGPSAATHNDVLSSSEVAHANLRGHSDSSVPVSAIHTHSDILAGAERTDNNIEDTESAPPKVEADPADQGFKSALGRAAAEALAVRRRLAARRRAAQRKRP